MKKIGFTRFFLFFFVIFSVNFISVSAQNLGRDLGVKTGLLPTNPFYFVKEWTRGFKRALTFDAVKKIEYDLAVLNEKAAELRKVANVAPKKTSLIEQALDNYETSLNYLITEVENVKLPAGADTDKLLDRLIDRALLHTELLSELVAAFADNSDLITRLKEARERSVALMAVVPLKMTQPEDFRTRLEQAINSQDEQFKELKAAEILEYLENALPFGDLKNEINKLKKDLLLRFGVQAQQSSGLDLYNQVAMDPLILLKLIDEVRKDVSEQDLKNKLNILRQDFLDKIAANGKIGQERARVSLDQAAELLVQLRGKKFSSVLEQATFYHSQAKNFFDQGNYSGSFSQAILSIGVAEEAMRQINLSQR